MTTIVGAHTRVVSIRGETIRIPRHAQERYHLHVQPAQAFEAAIANLVLIAELHGEVRRDAPAWRHRDHEPTESTAAWLWLGPDIAMPLVYKGHDLVATTTVARGAISDRLRARRNLERARQREQARTQFTAGRRLFTASRTRRFDPHEAIAEAA